VCSVQALEYASSRYSGIRIAIRFREIAAKNIAHRKVEVSPVPPPPVLDQDWNLSGSRAHLERP
jgi:hypothetical protein